MYPLTSLSLLAAIPLLIQAVNPNQRELDERLLPITATTTVVVGVTMTETVWVMPTGQAVFAPIPSPSASQSGESSSGTLDAGSSESSSAITSYSMHPTQSAISTSATSISVGVDDITSAVTQSVTSVGVDNYSSAVTKSSTSGKVDALTSAITASVSVSLLPSVSQPSTIASSATSAVIGSIASSASLLLSATASNTESVTYDAISSTSPSATSSSEPSSVTLSSVASSVTDSASITDSFTEAAVSSSTTAMPSWTATPSTLWSGASTTLSSILNLPSTTISAIPSATASSGSTLSPLPSTLMNGYYPDWSGWYLSPESVDFSRFDVIDFAFALPTSDNNLEFTQTDSSDLLTRLVKSAHASGKRVKLSIGGWTGSTYFSTICASSTNRAAFVKNIRAAVDSYNLDGIDIDWEYPGTGGASGNAVSPDDSANFLLFLTELRAALPVGSLISTATQVWPFADQNGNPMTDVSGFAKVIDYILIMNYDVWGSSTTPGANAPLNDGCGNSSQPLANAYAAVSSWTTAGMPANQITLGVPAYGYLQKSTATQLKDRRKRALHNLPHRRAGMSGLHERGSGVVVYNDNGGNSDGQVMWESLISQGALVKDGSGSWVGAGGFVREWDSCSSTPWLRSTSSGQIVTYDDTQSMSLKGQFAAQAGLRGCNVFSIDGDWTNGGWPLTDAVRSGLGL